MFKSSNRYISIMFFDQNSVIMSHVCPLPWPSNHSSFDYPGSIQKICSEWLSMTEYMTLFIVEVNGAAYKTESEKCIKNTAYKFCSTQSNHLMWEWSGKPYCHILTTVGMALLHKVSNPSIKQHSMLFPSNSNKGLNEPYIKLASCFEVLVCKSHAWPWDDVWHVSYDSALCDTGSILSLQCDNAGDCWGFWHGSMQHHTPHTQTYTCYLLLEVHYHVFFVVYQHAICDLQAWQKTLLKLRSLLHSLLHEVVSDCTIHVVYKIIHNNNYHPWGKVYLNNIGSCKINNLGTNEK